MAIVQRQIRLKGHAAAPQKMDQVKPEVSNVWHCPIDTHLLRGIPQPMTLALVFPKHVFDLGFGE